MSGEVRLSDERGISTRLVRALAELTARVERGNFALIGGLAVMARLRDVHRVTEDIDSVSQQIGDGPSAVAVVLGEADLEIKPQAFAGVTIDHIDVGSTSAASIPAADLPEDEWDRAFVLAHRWDLDAALPATLSAVHRDTITSSVTCLVASPSSLVTMKLQAAPRRPASRFHKAANDYLDLYRFLSNEELAAEIATDLILHAPHQLGIWAIERVRLEMCEGADNVARALRRTALHNQVSAGEVAAAAGAFLARAESLSFGPHRESRVNPA